MGLVNESKGTETQQVSVVTLADLFDEYHELIYGRVSAATARCYRVGWVHRIEPSLGSRDVTSISTLDVELAFSKWSGARSTRIDAFSFLSHLFTIAVKAGIVSSNPCIGAQLPKPVSADPTSRALSESETQKLFDALPASGVYRRFVLALVYTGCRLGEIAALRVADVDLDDSTIWISKTASFGAHGELRTGPTKGRKSRSVPIPAPLVEVLNEALEGKSSTDLVFPGARGGTLSSKNLSRALKWKSIRDSIKVFPKGEPPLHFHDLRHTAAVRLFESGLPATDVQAILGHSSLVVTQIYADTRKDAARRGAAALSALYERFFDRSKNKGVNGA